MLTRWFILLLALLPFNALSQPDSTIYRLASYVKNTNNFLRLYPQEKVYLHMDNTGYYIGETLWFKAYVMTSAFHRLNAPSKTLYVELVAPEGNVVETKKLKITDGQCHGNFHLDSANYSGYFEIRAYTRFMLNFGNAGIFSRVFPVFEKPDSVSGYDGKHLRPRERWEDPEKAMNEKQNSGLQLTFFPEGGSLIQWITSKIAFKATDGEGKEVSVTGEIRDDKKQLVTSFHTIHRGMGECLFCPEYERKYTAIVQYNNKEYRFPLPRPLSRGYALQVDNLQPEKVKISVCKNSITSPETLGLAILCRGWVCYFDVMEVATDQPVSTQVPRRLLATGVNQVILFNRSGKALAKRNIFVRRDSIQQISVKTLNLKSSYQPYEPVRLDFKLSDHKGMPVRTTFSVSVRDSSTDIESYFSDNMLTYMLLSSEIKGFIRDVGYYFQSDDSIRRRNLDLLLLVQGWSRYSWKLVSTGRPLPVKYPVETGSLIDGVAFDAPALKHRKALKNAPLKLQLRRDSLIFKDSTITDEWGNFSFLYDDIYGKWDLSLSVPEDKAYKYSLLLLNRQFSPLGKSYSYYECHLPAPVFSDFLIQNDTVFRNIILESTPVYAKQQVKIYHTPTIRVKWDEVVDEMLDKDIEKESGLNFQDYYGVVPGYLLSAYNLPSGYCAYLEKYKNVTRFPKYTLHSFVRDIVVDSLIIYTDLKTRMQYRYDLEGVYLFSFTQADKILLSSSNGKLKSLSPNSKYQTIDPQKREQYAQNHIADYVFLYVLPQDSIIERIMNPFKRDTYWIGYTPVVFEEFYSPDYSKTALISPDHRRTLYWSPEVKTDSTGQATIHFYNNSTKSVLRIHAETITPQGEIGILERLNSNSKCNLPRHKKISFFNSCLWIKRRSFSE